jgi:fructose-bisphosphate aldolase class II
MGKQLVTTKELFKKAYDGGYAIGAFNVNDMEILQGIVDAGNEERAPLILQVSAGARKYARHEYLVKLVEAAMLTTDIPIVLHLDHGEDFEVCKSCVDGGFSSVMIDASSKPFAENIRITKQVVEYAHAHGVTVEAELGKLAGVEDAVNVKAEDATYTDPKQVQEFVQATGVDSLAIAIGTSHGAFKFKGEPKLDFARLDVISKLVPGFPIVLHGASSVPQALVDECNKYGGALPGAQGVPEEMLRQAARSAVCKINIDTDLRLAMTATIRKVFVEKPAEFDPRKYLGPARDAIKAVVKHKLKDVLGCSGKA